MPHCVASVPIEIAMKPQSKKEPKPPKPRKCKCGCDVTFTPRNSFQVAAFPECAMVIAKKQRESTARKVAKLQRQATREAKEKLKTRSDWMKEAQQAVNAYVRLRDKDKECVSCGRPASWDGQWHASHFKSVGSNSFLRFNIWNIHKACSICNNHLSGNIGEYMLRLPDRIGIERFDFLMSAPRVRAYSIDYLKRLKKIFQKRARKLAMR